jgi:hypothetical protein
MKFVTVDPKDPRLLDKYPPVILTVEVLAATVPVFVKDPEKLKALTLAAIFPLLVTEPKVKLTVLFVPEVKVPLFVILTLAPFIVTAVAFNAKFPEFVNCPPKRVIVAAFCPRLAAFI